MSDLLTRLESAQAKNCAHDGNSPLDKCLRDCVAAIIEHVECEPGMYGNECVGYGGADGLKDSLAALARELGVEK